MNKLRVLVVDDSLTIRAALEEILQQGGRCQVVGSASSVEEARVLVEALNPDVLTLDLALPGEHGLTFLDERTGEDDAPSVVISSTTRPGTPASLEAIARGAISTFDKSRLVADAGALVRDVQFAALQHLRKKVAQLERDLRLSGRAC